MGRYTIVYMCGCKFLQERLKSNSTKENSCSKKRQNVSIFPIRTMHRDAYVTQSAFTCSKPAMEIVEQGVKAVQN